MASGGDGEFWRKYVNEGSLSVDWSGLAKLVAGTFVIDYALGTAMLINGGVDAVEEILGGLAGFAPYVGDVVAAGLGDLSHAAGAGVGFLSALGPVGGVLVLAVALVALRIYGAREGWF